MHVDLRTLGLVPLFLSLLIATAFLLKVPSAGLPALWAGRARREALAVGVGMSTRRAIQIVVVIIAYTSGLFAPAGQIHPVVTHLFSSLVLMAVLIILVSPLVL